VDSKLVGVAEMALMLGVTRQRVQQLTQRPDFPEPRHRFIMGNAWLLTDFTEWAKANGRTLRKI
jgi:hypothetical protein